MRQVIFIFIIIICVVGSVMAQGYVWANNLPGKLWPSECKEMAIDNDGNVLITGFIEDSVDFLPGVGETYLYAENKSPYVAKYSRDGKYLWARVFPVTGNYGVAEDVAVDDQGRVYITGFFGGKMDFGAGHSLQLDSTLGTVGAFLVKLSPEGEIIYTNMLQGNHSIMARVMHLHKNYVILGGNYYDKVDLNPGPGSFFLENKKPSLFFAAYDLDGIFLWGKSLTNARGAISDIDTDTSGNIYLAGLFGGTCDFDPGPGVHQLAPVAGAPYLHLFYAKYTPRGNFTWAYDIPVRLGHSNRDGPQIEVNHEDNVIISGTFAGKVDFDPGPDSSFLISTTGHYSAFFAAYNRQGSHKWSAQLEGAYSNGTGLALDAYENIYIAGDANGTNDFDPGPGYAPVPAPSPFRVYFAKYDSLGNYQWARITGNGGMGGSITNPTIHADTSYQYVCGYFRRHADLDPGPDSAILTAYHVSGFFGKYSLSGALVRYSCVDDSVWFKASNTDFIDSLVWIFTDDNGIEQNVLSFEFGHLFQTPGEKHVSLVSYHNGEAKREDFLIVVQDVPQVDLGSDRLICDAEEVVLDAGNYDKVVHWSDGSKDHRRVVAEPGSYWVRVGEGSCGAYDTIKLRKVNADLTLPNVITPNADGMNDFFYSKDFSPGTVYQLSVFNRWGRLVYQNSDYKGTWGADGLSEGVYYYSFRAVDDECGRELKGFVHVFR